MPVLMRSLSYSHHASFSLEEFLLRLSPRYNRTGWLGVKNTNLLSALKTPPASYAMSFIYIPNDDRFSEE